MRVKVIVINFIILLGIWLILNNTLQVPVLLVGVGVALLLAIVLCRNCSVLYEMKITPKAFLYTFLFLLVFFWELLKANVDVARRVLSPKLPINPGIIKAETSLKSKMARMILANSITLTPGTFTIDVVNNTFYIHCINVEADNTGQQTRSIIRNFEKYLEVIYG